jgi:dTDP-4-dehydrorhamnose 3,5-epimerase
MEFKETIFRDAWLIKPPVYQDNRGFFLEFYSKKKFEDKNIYVNFVQDNHSMSVQKGVLRGLHYQTPPFTQAKLIRVIKGSVYDVIVDIRKKSPTYGKWQGFTMSAENFEMLFVPKGFLHGFITLEDNTEFMYKVDQFYEPSSDAGIIWNDPVLGIEWPVSEPTLSDKDQKLPGFTNFETPFVELIKTDL